MSNVEDTNNSSDLSEFFSALSKEKKESRQKLEEEIANPESGLSNLFKQLEEAHRETQKVSEEIPDSKSLSPDDQNKLEAFSNLMNSVDVSLQEVQEETPEIEEKVEPVVAEVFNNSSEKEDEKLEVFSKLFDELAKVEEKQEPQEELVVEDETPKPQIVAQETSDIISDVISNLDDMQAKTEVKEEVDQITSIRAEFEKFKTHIQQHISNQGFSGGGSGETRVEFLDDVDRDSAKVDGKALIYQASSGKWIGGNASGGSSAADDLTAGDAAVLLTTSSGNITIDAAANNSDIIFKGTDGGADTTFLTIDGSDAGTLIANHDLELGTDGSIIKFGADNEIALTHVHNTGLLLTDSGGSPTLQFHDTNESVSSDGSKLILTSGGTAFSLPTADGSNGQALATNGSGVLSFIDVSSAADDLTAGDAAVTLTTSSGNITIDAAANDSDIIFKGTDGGSDITMLTLDGSAAGAATFNDKIIATELDISGDVDIDGTLEADAITVNGTSLAETISDTVGAMVGSNTETGIAVTYQDGDNTLDFALGAAQTTITSLLATDIKIGEDDQTKIDFETADEIHFYAANAHQVKLVDGALVPVTDNDIDLGTSSLEFKDAFFDGTVTSDAFAGPLTGDVTGNADTATALATARTIHGVSFDGSANIDLTEVVEDTVGAMVSSNTETGITVTYQDGDGTIDFALAAAQTTITSLLATDIKIGEDDQTKIDFETADEIHFYAANAHQIKLVDGALVPATDNDIDLGTSSVEFKDAYFDGTVTADAFAGPLTGDVTGTADVATVATTVTITDNESTNESNALIFAAGGDVDGGNLGLESDGTLTYNPSTGIVTATGFAGALTGNVTGNASGTAATVTGAAQTNITSLGTLTALTVDNVVINGATIGHGDDTDLMTVADGVLTVAGEVSMTTLDIGGTNVTSTAAELNVLDGITAVVGELNALDIGSTAVGTAVASKAVILDSNKDYTGIRNFTVSGEVDAATGDFSGAVDIAGDLTLSGGGDGALTFGSTSSVKFGDNAAASLVFEEGDNAYMTFVTTNSSEAVKFDKALDINATVQIDATLTVGVNDTGYDVKLFGATDGAHILWDASDDALETAGGATINIVKDKLKIGGTAVTTTAAELNLLDTASANSVVNSKAVIYGSSGELAGTLSTAAQTSVTSLGTLTALTVDDVAINGKEITMTGSSSDTAVFTVGTNGTLSIVTTDDAAAAANIQITADGSAELAGTTVTLDSGGNIVLDADGGTITFADAGSSLGTITSSGYSGTAAVATTVTITDNESTNENNAIVFTAGGDVDGGNLGLESDGDLTYNPSTGTLSVTNIVVSGTQTITDSVTMNANNAVIFEGATADAHETTLTSVDATGDRTISLPNVSGTLPVLAAASTTQITSTPEELNILDGATVVVGEINALDLGSTAVGNAIASKAVILDSNKDYTGMRNLTISGEIDAATGDFSGAVDVAGATTTAAITASGIIKTDDATEATSTTDGSLQTDGGLSVVKDAVFGDDVKLLSDAAVLGFGADGDVTLTHVADTGVLLNAAMVVQFRDSAINIGSPADGDLDINADDEIELNSTLIDVNGNLDVSGTGVIAGAVTTAALTASGIIKTDDATEATSTTDGSLQTDGGLSVVKDAVFGDDIKLLSDSAVAAFGADGEVTLTHVHNTGLTLTHTGTGDNLPVVLQLKSEEDAIEANEVIGSLEFAAGDSDGTDGATVAAGIHAIAEGTFSASANATKLVFTTGVSETAASSATAKMTLSSAGLLTIADDFIIKDGGTIGSASDVDAIAIGSDGDVTLTQDLELQHDGAILSFGADDDVSLTHVHNTGLLLNAAMVVQFRDSAINIGSPADGDLDINADDEIELNSTLIDINGNVEISGTLAQADAITMATNKKIIFRDTAIHISSTADGDLAIAADDEIDLTSTLIDVNGNLDVSGTYQGGGTMTTGGNIVIPDAGTIGSASDTDAIAIGSDGDVTLTQDLELQHDGAILSFGANDEVTLTHVHNDGLLLNADMQLQFRDSAINIRSDADGDLDINADDEIELNSTLIDINGAVDISGATTVGGILKTDDATDATSTTDGSLQTDGGLSVAKDAVIGNDLLLLSDSAVIKFGADSDITLTHAADTSLTTNGVMVATTFEPSADTSSGDDAAIGYTSAEGLILTGQGSTNDVTIKNDADADVIEIPTGTTNVTVAGNLSVGATVNSGSGVIENSATIAANITITSGSNAMSSGPITVNSGVTVTVSSGSRWVVL